MLLGLFTLTLSLLHSFKMYLAKYQFKIILLKSPLSFFASLDLVSIWESEWLLRLVKINEVSEVKISKLVHYVPSIVLWDRNLVQSHVF